MEYPHTKGSKDKEFLIWEFGFLDEENYNSIELKRSEKFVITKAHYETSHH